MCVHMYVNVQHLLLTKLFPVTGSIESTISVRYVDNTAMSLCVASNWWMISRFRTSLIDLDFDVIPMDFDYASMDFNGFEFNYNAL